MKGRLLLHYAWAKGAGLKCYARGRGFVVYFDQRLGGAPKRWSKYTAGDENVPNLYNMIYGWYGP
jgi:hypothetical protein